MGAGATLAAGAAGATLVTGAAASTVGRASLGASRAAGGASSSYASGAAGKQGMRAFGSGLAQVARDAASGASSPLRRTAERLRESFDAGKKGAAASDAPAAAGPAAVDAAAPAGGPPPWAKSMHRRQTIAQGATVATQTLKSGDSHGGGAGPDINQKD
jgi:type IV secretion system protein TrbL